MAKKREKFVRPITIRRPHRVPTRLCEPSHNGLFALHTQTHKSMSALIYEFILEGLQRRNMLDKETVKKQLALEKNSRTFVRTPVL